VRKKSLEKYNNSHTSSNFKLELKSVNFSLSEEGEMGFLMRKREGVVILRGGYVLQPSRRGS
jgi:hypothetical protein